MIIVCQPAVQPKGSFAGKMRDEHANLKSGYIGRNPNGIQQVHFNVALLTSAWSYSHSSWLAPDVVLNAGPLIHKAFAVFNWVLK